MSILRIDEMSEEYYQTELDFEPELVEVDKLNSTHWVTKHNDLVETSYDLTLQQQRILLIIASRIEPEDNHFKLYQFNTRDVIEIFGSEKSTGYYSHVKSVIDDLQSKTFKIKTEKGLLNVNWVITSYYPSDQEGFFQVALHPRLKPFFLKLKERYTKYRIENVLKLSSHYTIRIYELLKQFESIKKRTFTLDKLKELLGIEPDKYKMYGHFKSKILLPSQKQISSFTDLHFDFIEIKKGRKVIGLEFHISSQGKKTREILPEDVIEKELLSFGISKSNIKKIRSNWDDDYISRNIEYTKERMERINIKNPSGFLMQSFTDDYAGIHIENVSEVSDQLSSLKGEGIDFENKRYNMSIEDFEKRLISIRDLKRDIGVLEEDVQKSTKDEIGFYANYQKDSEEIQSSVFIDEEFQSYFLLAQKSLGILTR